MLSSEKAKGLTENSRGKTCAYAKKKKRSFQNCPGRNENPSSLQQAKDKVQFYLITCEPMMNVNELWNNYGHDL